MKVVWVDPNTFVEPYPSPKNCQLGPQKVKIDPEIKQKSNIRIDENIQNENGSTAWADPTTVFELFLNPKKNH